MQQTTHGQGDLEAGNAKVNRFSNAPTEVDSSRTASATPAMPAMSPRNSIGDESRKADDDDIESEKQCEEEDSEKQDQPPTEPQTTEEPSNIVDWDGPKDPENPQNWSRKYKWSMIMILGFMTFVVSFGSSVWSTAVVVTAEQFDVSQEVMILGVTLYVLGFALGPLVFGPLSELYGRRNPLMIGMFGFLIFQIPIGVATNLQTIFVCRFFGGAFGSAALAIVPGLAVDLFDAVERAIATMAYAAAVFAGPAVGPIVGEFTVKNRNLGWHWTGWFTMIMGACFYIIALPLIKETFPPILLKQKAARLRHETKNWALHTKLDEQPVNATFLLRKYGLKPLEMLIYEPILMFMTAYVSLVYGILYLIFFAYPVSFEQDRGIEFGLSSLPFISLFIGVLAACIGLAWETKVIFTPKMVKAKKLIPEERLPPMMVGAVILIVGLFWFAWTSYPSITVWPQIVSGIFIGCGIIMVFMPAVIYLVDVYLFEANSALAANTFVRSLIAAAFPLFSPYMYRDLGTQWATSLLGFLCLALLPATFALYKYGGKIRSWSRFAYNLG